MIIDKNHPFNIAAYLGFINWALGIEELRKQFQEETGMVFISPARGGLAALIDEACGVKEGNKKYVRAFVLWVTENYWGTEDETPDNVFTEEFWKDQQEK